MKNVKSFQTNYVLIDHENVQPKNLSLLSEDHFKIYLFIGAKQTCVNFGLVDAMHKFGPKRSEYIQVTQTRANALDFHITYYLGLLVAKNSSSYFHIISKDKGFDPLIEHLTAGGINAYRRESIADIPVINVNSDAKIDEKFEPILKNLKGRRQSKPRKEKTLKNSIKKTFNPELTETEVTAVFDKLRGLKYIKVEKDRVSYALPK